LTTETVLTPAANNDDDVLETDLAINMRRMCRIASFMSRASQIRCSSDVRRRLADSRKTPSLSSSVTSGLRKALEELENHTLSVPSMRRSCSIVIWRACRRHIGNVYKLPAPNPLINIVIDQLG
jgi:hypothetical protein